MVFRVIFFVCAALSIVITQPSFSQNMKVALIQSCFEWGDTEKNIASFGAKIATIDSCDMIIMPELFASGCDMRKRDRELKVAEKIKIAAEYHHIIDKMQMWAKESGAVIVGSTIYQEGDKFYNRLLAVYPTGEFSIYDKHNCFKMGSFSPGNDHLVIDVKGHRYATYICYDLQFPDWSRNNGRYDSAIYIANWPESRAEGWNSLLRERALENGAYVIGVNCVGTDLGGVNYMGDSSVYSPSGELIASCKSNTEQILVVQY